MIVNGHKTTLNNRKSQMLFTGGEKFIKSYYLYGMISCFCYKVKE